jgi:hypothetical protein
MRENFMLFKRPGRPTAIGKKFCVLVCAWCLFTCSLRAEDGQPSGGNADTQLQELRLALAEQQRQIQQLREELLRRVSQLEALNHPATEPGAERLVLPDATADPRGQPRSVALNREAAPGAAGDSLKSQPIGTSPPSQSVLPNKAVPPLSAAVDSAVRGPAQAPASEKPAKWYEKIGLRGYSQFRYNRLLETNPSLVCEQCDRSIGDNNGFFIRRARLVLSGDIHERVSMYFQQDFATASGTSLNFGQIRDLYFDLSLDRKKELRVRFGQSKVPFGFENLQSSQNRLALDRSDSLNSAVANERDLGVYVMYAPSHLKQRFKYLVDSGLKGTGDYGVMTAGVFNGQTANRPEANDNLHSVVRISYPFQLGNGQIIEPGIQAFTGRFVVGDRGASTLGPAELRDYRAAVSLVIYPQPLGFQAEYNSGRGPAFNPDGNRIEERNSRGGYGQVMYRLKLGNQFLTPFVKAQYYSGGKKHEFDARRHLVREQEFGLEWQPLSVFEFTAMYTHSDRRFEDSRNPQKREKGRLLRLQAQFNY